MKIIKKLFGQTETMQYNYLKPRLIILGASILLILFGALLSKLGISFGGNILVPIGSCIFAIILLVFGWAVIRGLFGYTTILALFTKNIGIGIFIFIIYFMVGYLLGMFVAIVGFCRFLVILKKRK